MSTQVMLGVTVHPHWEKLYLSPFTREETEAWPNRDAQGHQGRKWSCWKGPQFLPSLEPFPPPATCTPRMCSKLHCALVLLMNAHNSLLKTVYHWALKITYLTIALRLPGEMHVSFLFNLCVITKI